MVLEIIFWVKKKKKKKKKKTLGFIFALFAIW
jgi:hypothetical protein